MRQWTAKEHTPKVTVPQQGLKYWEQPLYHLLNPDYDNGTRRKRSRPLYDDPSAESYDSQPTKKKMSQEEGSNPQLDGSSDRPVVKLNSDSATLCSEGGKTGREYNGSDGDVRYNSATRQDSAVSTLITPNMKTTTSSVDSFHDVMVEPRNVQELSSHIASVERMSAPSSPVYPTAASYELETYINAEKTANRPASKSILMATESEPGARSDHVLRAPTSMVPTANELEENGAFDRGYRARLRKPNELHKTRKAMEQERSLVAHAGGK